MFSKLPQKTTSDYRLLGAFLAMFIASGAVAGTVLLTRAPGMTLGPKNIISRALNLAMGERMKEAKNKAPLATDSTGQTRASKTISKNATGKDKPSSTRTGNGSGSNSGISADRTSGARRLGWIEIGTDSLSGANTNANGTIARGFARAPYSTLSGVGAVRSGSTATSLQILALDADISWTGATSTAWSTSTNWSSSTVPGNLDNALFDGTFSNQPTLTAAASVGGLWMTDSVGQDVTIGGAHLLSIEGNTIGSTPNLGILIDSSPYALTIDADIKVVNSQTWTNNGNLFTITGGVNVNNVTLTIRGGGNTLITGVISGGAPSSSLTKADEGTLTITGSNTYQGVTIVTAGTLLVNGNQSTAHGDVTVTGNGTTLGGTGIIGGPITVFSGANIAPGNGGNSTAILGTGALTLQSGSNFLVDINGTTAGIGGYDQLNVNGTVIVSGSNLMVTVGTTLTIGQTFIIVNNDSTDAVTGQFAQGSSVTSGLYTFSINYAGGTGNDIVLEVTAVPEPGTWFIGALAFAGLAYIQWRRSARTSKRSRAPAL
jgi:autotransporter-associated beta strand protein